MEFEKVVEEFTLPLYRLAYSYCLSRPDAEDAVQETLMRYLTKPPRYSCPAQLRAWLMTVCANLCRDQLRSPWRQKQMSLIEASAQPPQMDDSIAVRTALAALPPKFRGVVYLFYYEQCSTKEIAALLHLSDTAVRSRLFQAKKKLRGLLGGK